MGGPGRDMAERPGLEGGQGPVGPETTAPPEDVAKDVFILVGDLLGVSDASRRKGNQPGLERRAAHHVPESDLRGEPFEVRD